MQPEQIDNARSILAQQHTQWLESAVTVASRRVVEEVIAKLDSYTLNKASNFEVTGDEIRFLLGQLKSMKQLQKQLYDTKAFVERAIPAE